MTTKQPPPPPTTTAAFELIGLLPKLPKVSKATAAQKDRIRGASNLAFLVPFETLVLGNDNIRDAAANPEKLKRLADNIRAVGLLQPPPCTPYTDDVHTEGAWLVAAGHRRFLALVMLGFKAGDLVPIHPLDAADAGTRAQRMVAENFHRENLSPIEEATMIERLQAFNGMSQRAIADMLGWNKSTVNKRLNLLELPLEVQARVEAGTMATEIGEQLGKLIRDGLGEADVKRLVQDSDNGWATNDTMRHAATRLKGAQAAATLAARLEARGVHVVVKASRAPTKKGHEAYQDRALQLDTAAAVRELDLAELGTIKAKDGKPVLLVDRRHDGGAVAWVLKQRKPIEHAYTSGVSRDYTAERAARQALHRLREAAARQVETPPSDIEALRCAAAALIGNMGIDDVRVVGQWLGLDVVTGEFDRVLRVPTAAKWLDGAPTRTIRAIMWAAVRVDAANMADDGFDTVRPLHVEHLVGLGMPAPLGEAEFAEATERARAKLDALAADDEHAGADPDGEEG